MSRERQVRAVIVEDEPHARASLREYASDVSWLTVVGEAVDGAAAVTLIDEVEPDLVFLDICLPEASGLEVLERVRHRSEVVFTTAHDQYALAAFELGALDYLLKPFGRERFGRALERARPVLEQRAGVSAAQRARETLSGGPLARLFVRAGGRVVPVPIRSIERLEAADDTVVVHAPGGPFTVNLPLSVLEERLDPRTFVRVHRSHVVNLDHVSSWTPYDGSRFQIRLRSGATIMASRQRSRELRDLGR